MMARFILLFLACAVCAPAVAGEAKFDPKPWIADLAEMHTIFATKYANLEWAVFDREADLPKLFADAEKRIENAQDETDARAAFERLVRRLGDGHVEIHWHASQSEGPSLPCSSYDPGMVGAPMAARMKGYEPIEAAHSDLFPIGIVTAGGSRVGVLRIGLFMPEGYPGLCKAAIAALGIPADRPCDDACSARIDDYDNRAFSDAFMAQLETLKAAHVDVLLVDITGNGGGSEWAEAAVRMLSPLRLKSERVLFVRGEHWVKHFAQLESDLEKAAASSPSDRATLLEWAKEAAAKKEVAATPCDSAPLWEGRHPDCAWLGEGFSMAGILASGDPDTLREKSWAPLVFSPMEFPWREGIWRGPLIVAVDSGTGSASEEFASVLQDNHAGLIVGEPTVGVGCGHTDGGTPTTLSNSRAVVVVPDCARVRADGSNENRGVRPDILIGWRHGDGPGRRAADFAQALPGIVEAARRAEK